MLDPKDSYISVYVHVYIKQLNRFSILVYELYKDLYYWNVISSLSYVIKDGEAILLSHVFHVL